MKNKGSIKKNQQCDIAKVHEIVWDTFYLYGGRPIVFFRCFYFRLSGVQDHFPSLLIDLVIYRVRFWRIQVRPVTVSCNSPFLFR